MLDGGEALADVFDDLSGVIEGDVQIAGEAVAAAAAVAGLVWGVRKAMGYPKEGSKATNEPR